MKRTKQFFLIIFSLILAFSCGKEPENNTSVNNIVASNIVVPSKIEVQEGDNISFRLIATTGATTSDYIVLRSASQNDYVCKIVSVGSNALVFELPSDLVGGRYSVYIQSNGINKYVGATEITVMKSLDIEVKDGTNIYGLITCDGVGVPGVIVSDGYEVVTTDSNGVYQIQSQKQQGYVFMTIPSGYEVPSDGILPEFHSSVSSSISTVDRRDFTLIKSDNENFTFFILGDMHLANRNNDLNQFKEVALDCVDEINATSGKKYCLTLGDMTWDLYWYDNNFTFPNYLVETNKYFKDILFFHTMGNHDNDMNEAGDFKKEFQYIRDIGPTYYSYNLGKIHGIVLDDIDYNNVGTGSAARGEYVCDITKNQMDWLKKDLAYVPKGSTIILSTHAPIMRPNSTGWYAGMSGANATGEANTDALLAALKDYKVHAFTAHTHKTFNYDNMEKGGYFEHNAGAVCAAWWWSGKLTPGVHVSTDGAPGGYTVLKVKGNDMSWQYKSSGWPFSYQFRTYDMNEVKKNVTMDIANNNSNFQKYVTSFNGFAANDVLINVWNYDSSWKVSVTENGKELTVTPLWAYDPLHVIALTAKRMSTATSPSFCTDSFTHFFKVNASSASSTLSVKVTDRFGNVYTETMTRPKAFNTNNYLNK